MLLFLDFLFVPIVDKKARIASQNVTFKHSAMLAHYVIQVVLHVLEPDLTSVLVVLIGKTMNLLRITRII